jgi:DNA-directed RNA polymerase subunit K/omega
MRLLYLFTLSKKLYDILHFINLITYFLVILTMSSFLESRELRKLYKEVREYVKIGPIFLTRYEKARITGARALQLSYGAPILIEKPKEMIDPIKIAMLELKSGILPLTIRRENPNGEYQDIPINKLILKKD